MVSAGSPPRVAKRTEERWGSGVAAMPALLLHRDRVYRATASGPAPVMSGAGRPIEFYDIIDPLAAEHPRLFVVDLEAIDGRDPQLDLMQEVSREISLWVDAGVRTADQAIDVLVAGAERAVLSSARLNGPEELARAWSLSPNLAVEIELQDGTLTPVHPDWRAASAADLAQRVLTEAQVPLIVGFRAGGPDWPIVRSIASQAPTWVAGEVGPSHAPEIQAAGAIGGIYPLGDEIRHYADVP